METPTTLAEVEQLQEWATTTTTPRRPAATTDQIARHLDFIAAALPSRGNDPQTGRMRAAVYASILAGRSNEALAFMARRACETLEWFPSPKQCLDILADYRPPKTPQAAALLACDQARHKLFGEWLADLRGGAPIGNVPEQWKRIAVEQGDVRRLEDGSFVSRILYHGPSRPPYQSAARERSLLIPNAAFQLEHTSGEAGASAGLVT